jgi:hypothetical protein
VIVHVSRHAGELVSSTVVVPRHVVVATVPPVIAAGVNPFAVNMRGKHPRPKALADRVTALGLHDGLGEAVVPWAEEPSDEERRKADGLIHKLNSHVRLRNLSDSRLRTAVGLLEDFRIVFPNWVLFMPLGGPDELVNAVHNERTFGILAEFKRAQGSKQIGHVGEKVLAKTIAGYISSLRAERSIGAGYNLLSTRAINVSSVALKAMRHEDGPSEARALRRGLRAQHFRKAVANGLDITSRQGIQRMARSLVAWNLLLRGGEVGTVDIRNFVCGIHLLTLASVTWFSRDMLADLGNDEGFPAVRLMVVPVKDTYAKVEPPRPSWIRRRLGAEFPHLYDPTCPYDMLMELYRMESAGAEVASYSSMPLFCNPDGSMVKSKDVRVDARVIGCLAGIDPAELGASSFRIGGAEDLYDMYEEAANPIIQERGRWCTDIHKIYQRASASRHMRVSAAMGSAMGISMEAAAPTGWALPARRTHGS